MSYDLTQSEDDALLAMAHAISEAEQSPHQPRCIRRAFASNLPELKVGPWTLRPLTMQMWIDLDHLAAEVDPAPEHTELCELAGMLSILSGEAISLKRLLRELPPEEALEVREKVDALIRASGATAIGMRHPSNKGADAGDDDGFGPWIVMLAALIAMGESRAEALAMRVDQAHAILAAGRRNEGWVPTGANYRYRDLN